MSSDVKAAEKVYISRDKILASDELMGILLPFARETVFRKNHPSKNYVPDDAEDRNQLAFHSSPSPIRILQGGNQSGKSRAAAQEIFWILDGTHPYSKSRHTPKIFCLSAQYRTLQEGIWEHLNDILPRWNIVKRGSIIPQYNIPSYLIYRGKKGDGRIDFISAEGGEPARRRVSGAHKLTDIFIDEEVDAVLWDELQVRRLRRGARIVISATFVRSEDWLLDLEDRAETGDDHVKLFRLDTRAAVRAGHLKKRVYDELEATLSPEEIEVRLRGRSRRSQGLVYAEFSDIHTCDEMPIPPTWTRYMAIDPGWRTAAVLWAAVAPDEKYYLYRELYVHHINAFELADMIFAAEGWKRNNATGDWEANEQTEQITQRFIDPSAFGHHETGEPRIGHLLTGYGLPLTPGNNDIEAGIQAVKRTLMADMDGVPKCRVFKTLREFMGEVRKYRRPRDSRDATKNEKTDKPIARFNHLMDCWKYLVAGNLIHRPRPNSYIEALRNMDRYQFAQPTVKSTSAMSDRMKEHWERIMYRQRHRHHRGGPGYGLGSES